MLRAGRDLSGPWQAWSDEHYDACACKLRPEETRDDLPDLDDPATLGCLLALVRAAWGVGSLVYRPWNGAIRAWRVVTFAHEEDWMTVARILGEGATEAEALVAALEAAP